MTEATEKIISTLWRAWFKSAVIGFMFPLVLLLIEMPEIGLIEEISIFWLCVAIFNYHFFVLGVGSDIEKKGGLLQMGPIGRASVFVNFYGFALCGTLVFIWLWVANA